MTKSSTHERDAKKERDWLVRLLVGTAVAMLIKVNTKVADLGERLAVVETTLTFIAPPPKHSLFEPRLPQQSAVGFHIPALLKGWIP